MNWIRIRSVRRTGARILALALVGIGMTAVGVTQRRPIIIQRPPIVTSRPPLKTAFPPPSGTIAQPILTTTYTNPTFNTSSPTWAKTLVGGRTFLSGLTGDAPFEWTQVLSPGDEIDHDFVGASGWALSPSISDRDNPFLHPFGFDFEFFLAPDLPYQRLAAPSTDKEYVDSKNLAAQRGHAVPATLGMEVDQDLVPGFYRTHDNDRVAMWGRWIVDTGHGDFHTEIHPPALLVNARPNPNFPNEETDSTILGRAYFVSQHFEVDDYPMKKHLLNEIAKVQGYSSLSLEAHPKIGLDLPNSPDKGKPFEGVHLLTFTVRPPSGRLKATDRLFATYKFTVRTGVAVQLINDTDCVRVMIVMNSAGYKVPKLPTAHHPTIGPSDLKKLNSDAGTTYYEAIAAAAGISIIAPGLTNPIAAILDANGIQTDRYDAPVPILGNPTTVNVTAIAGNTPNVIVNDNQPFPISGYLNLKWDRSASAAIAR